VKVRGGESGGGVIARGRLVLTIIVGGAVIVGIVAGYIVRRDRVAEPALRPRSTATLAIVEPLPGVTISGTSIQIRLALTGARLVLQTSTRLVPDEGHIHVKLDGKLVSMTAGLEQQVPVTTGPHIIGAEFVANDHLPFNPRILTTLPFVVR
jgi:hypothetical protein